MQEKEGNHHFKTLMQLRNLYLVNFLHHVFPCLAHYNWYSGRTMNITITHFLWGNGYVENLKERSTICLLLCFFAAHLSEDWCGLPASIRHLWTQRGMYLLYKNAAYSHSFAIWCKTPGHISFVMGFLFFFLTLLNFYLWLLFKRFIWFPLLGVFCLLKAPTSNNKHFPDRDQSFNWYTPIRTNFNCLLCFKTKHYPPFCFLV